MLEATPGGVVRIVLGVIILFLVAEVGVGDAGEQVGREPVRVFLICSSPLVDPAIWASAWEFDDLPEGRGTGVAALRRCVGAHAVLRSRLPFWRSRLRVKSSR